MKTSRFCCPAWKLKYVVISLITCVWLLLSSTVIAKAQDLENTLGWKPFGTVGDVAYAPVRLDGQSLFSIAAERKKDKDNQWGLDALEMRRDRIDKRLSTQVRYLVANNIDPSALQVITTQLNGQMAVQILTNNKASKPIVTITALDAEVYGLTEAEVAEEYAQRIRQGLIQAVEERQPDAQRSHLQWAAIGAGITAAIMGFLFVWQRQLNQKRRPLRKEYRLNQKQLMQQQELHGNEETAAQEISATQGRLFDLKRQIERKTWHKRILQLLLVGVGVAGLAWILQRFPQTRGLGVLLFRQPILLVLIGLSTLLAIILSHLLTDWLLNKWVGAVDQFSPDQIERRRKRLLTISPVWKGFATILLVIVGLIAAYSLFSLATGVTLFAGLGVLGVAASLTFQSSIKDALTGWMLLGQDAFALGDTIAVKEATGIVENMNLLMTQIRSSAGDLITLRNGEITSVINQSKDWSRMDFTVLVNYDTDVKQAMSILKEVLQTMQSHSVWGTRLIGEPDILGVERFEQNGILLRIRTQTQAGQQFAVTREFRLRLLHAFQAAGITIPLPQREVRYRSSEGRMEYPFVANQENGD